MKRLFYIILILAFIGINIETRGQKNRPFLEDGKQWVTLMYNFMFEKKYFTTSYTAYSIQGDTIIDNEIWKKLYKDFYTGHRLMGIVREENGVVYKRQRLSSDSEETISQPFMDLNYSVGDTISGFAEELDMFYRNIYGGIILTGLRTIDLNNKTYHTWDFLYPAFNWKFSWIDGIGCVGINDERPPFLCSPFTLDKGNLWGENVEHLIDCRTKDEVLFTVDSLYTKYYLQVINGISHITESDGGKRESFDLQGRRLTAEPQHGVFIKGGKKVAK